MAIPPSQVGTWRHHYAPASRSLRNPYSASPAGSKRAPRRYACSMRRRDFLNSALALTVLSSADLAAADRRDAPRPFDYASLKGQARALASSDYRPPQHLAPEFLRALTYDQYQAIRFRHDHALWARGDGQFRLEFFHCGRGFKEPVDLY